MAQMIQQTILQIAKLKTSQIPGLTPRITATALKHKSAPDSYARQTKQKVRMTNVHAYQSQKQKKSRATLTTTVKLPPMTQQIAQLKTSQTGGSTLTTYATA